MKNKVVKEKQVILKQLFMLFDKFTKEACEESCATCCTRNELAKICMNGEEPPEEFADPLWGACPLLSNQRCMI